MTVRTYITLLNTKTVIDENGSRLVYYPAWKDESQTALKIVNAAVSIGSGLGLGRIDTDDAQHNDLKNSARVVYVPKAMMGKTLVSLTAAQRNKLDYIYTSINVDLNTTFKGSARVRDILKLVMGDISRNPIQQAIDEPDS